MGSEDTDRHPDPSYLATIHHGLDLAEFTFQSRLGEYLLFFSRIHPDKGALDAIRVARAAGRALILAGIVRDRACFDREVQPQLSTAVGYVGVAGPAERDKLLGGALGLPHLIHFAEPSGLSVVEAMACGTPVIAYPRGSMPELIEDGVSGFLVADEAEAVTAAARLRILDRMVVRSCAERFSPAGMVEAYLSAYRTIVSE